MNDNPQKYAQGGEDDTNREQPKGTYQQQQGSSQQDPEQAKSSSQDALQNDPLLNKPASAYSQGGQDDADRDQPKGNYQDAQGQGS